MSKREVITFTCDVCPAEDISESNIDGDWKKPMPKGWVDFNVVSNDGVLHSKHLCPVCYMSVTAALIEREAEIGKG